MAIFNGVTLPDLPNYDKNAYPYAYVVKIYVSEYDFSTYMFMVTDKKVQHDSEGVVVLSGTKMINGSLNTSKDAWEYITYDEITVDTPMVQEGVEMTIIWSEEVEPKYYLFKESEVKDIADSIRRKTGKSNPIVKEDFSSEIDGIAPKLQNKTITENGTYSADSGYDALGEVSVNVASSGGAELNIHYGDTEPSDTSKLWVKCAEPSKVLVDEITFGDLVVKGNIASATDSFNYSGVGAVGSKIYVFGGYKHNGIYIFDSKTNICEKLSVTLPTNLYDMGVGVVGSKIYIFGGYDGSSARNEIHMFDTETNTLTTLSTTLPVELRNMGVGVYGSKIYLFGGRYGSSEVDTIYTFYTSNNTISKLSKKLSTSHEYIKVGVVGNNMYLLCGGGRIYKYFPSNDTFSQLSVSVPNSTYYFDIGVIDNEIYILGGYVGANSVDTIHLLDCSTNTISTLSTKLPKAMMYHRVGVVGTNIFIFYGSGVYKISKDFELESGKVQIRPSLTQNLFNILNGDITVKMGVIDAYLGNSDNVGEQVEALLYKDGAWTPI